MYGRWFGVVGSIVGLLIIGLAVSRLTAQEARLEDTLWTVRGGGLARFDPWSLRTDGHQLPIPAPLDVAVDDLRRVVWARTERGMSRYSFEGDLLDEIRVPASSAGAGSTAVNSVDGSAWLLRDSSLLTVSFGGQLVGETALRVGSRRIVAALSEGLLWMIGERTVTAFAALQNVPLRSLNRARRSSICAAAWNPVTRQLWLATRDRLEVYDVEGGLLAVHPIGGIRRLVHGGGEPLWALSPAGIVEISRGGAVTHLSNDLNLAGPPVDLAVKGEYLWVTDGQALVRMSSSGRTLEQVQTAGGVERLILSPGDRVAPRIRMIHPRQGQVVESVDLELELDLTDVGTGIDASTLKVKRREDGLDLSCRVVGSRATCEPRGPAPLGPWTIVARVADRAGNLSEPVDLSFEVTRHRIQRRKNEVATRSTVRTTLHSVADTYIARGSKFDNHGSLDRISVQSSGSHRGLLRFDLAPAIEAIETLESASLRLRVVENGGNWGSRGRQVSVHRMKVGWSESGATWLCPDRSDAANSSEECVGEWDGGDFERSPTAAVLHNDATAGWIEFDVTSDVNRVLSGDEDRGWIVIRSGGGSGHVAYASRESSIGGLPELVLDYVEADRGPPTLRIDRPTPGEVVARPRPEIALSFSDAQSGVDVESLRVLIRGMADRLPCTAELESAICVPSADLPDGSVTVEATVEDRAGNVSESATTTFTVDTVEPTISLTYPPNGLLLREGSVEVAGQLSEPASLLLDGTAISVGEDLSFRQGASLAEGENLLHLEATDVAGHRATASVLVTVDSIAPPPVELSRLTVGGAIESISSITGGEGASEAGAQVEAVNERTGAATVTSVAPDGSFQLTVSAVADDSVRLTATDPAGNSSAPVSVTVPDDSLPEPPVDPELVATPTEPTIQSDIHRDTAFLYQGEAPIQTGVDAELIAPELVSVLQGRVSRRDGAPLESVVVRIVGRAEFGQTVTRTDGEYDLVVNGGGPLTVEMRRPGYLTVQRTVDVPWRDYVTLGDVTLVPRSPVSTQVELSAATTQVARGAVELDVDGSRQSTAIVLPGTSATMTLTDGTQRSLQRLTLRSTEYTVGETGPAAMPGDLPQASGYTYAVEISADEAVAAEAISVDFSKPLVHYVENFLGLPIGVVLPAGYYDRQSSRWIGSDDGRVVAVLGIVDGVAQLDVDGGGAPAGATDLEALGISSDELAQVAQLYGPGQQLWRVPIPHLTPWDFNCAYGPPLDAVPPPTTPLATELDDPCLRSGSILECENQVLHLRMPLVGTEWALQYSSARVPGRLVRSSVRVRLSEDTVPQSLGAIRLEIRVAGQYHRFSFPPDPGQEHTFTWNGEDAYGRRIYGSVPVDVRVGYSYLLTYYETLSGFSQAWGRVRGQSMDVSRLGSPWVTLWTEFRHRVSAHDPEIETLGGWSVTARHFFDRDGEVLHLGSGARRGVSAVPEVVERVAGTPEWGGTTGDGGPAIDALIETPKSIAVRPDGGFCIGFNYRVRCVDKDGIIQTVAGTGVNGSSGDGGPALEATMRSVADLAIAADGTLFISDIDPVEPDRIRRVDRGGIISTVATFADGSNHVSGLAIGPEGRLHFSDDGLNRVFRLEEDGSTTRIAGNGDDSPSGDGGPAVSAGVPNPRSLDFGADGSLYILSVPDQIRRVRPDGMIERFAGKWRCLDAVKDVDQATSTCFGTQPKWVETTADGTVYMSEGPALRKIREGLIMPGPGWKAWRTSGLWPTPGAAAYDVRFGGANGVGALRNGDLLLAENRKVVWRIRSAMRGEASGPVQVASRDGGALYRFDYQGRHLETIDTLTGEPLRTFEHDEDGRLVAILNRGGEATRIERDASGRPTAIVSPFGQRTALIVNADGFLESMTNPAGEASRFEYSPGGLLTAHTDARSSRSAFAYDSMGRLVSDRHPEGGTQILTRSEAASVVTVELRDPTDQLVRFEVERRPGDVVERRVGDPASGQWQTAWRGNGGRFESRPDGTTVEMDVRPDPRFGLTAPLPSWVKMITPGGLIRTVAVSRTVEATDPGDPASLTALVETVRVNGRAYLRRFDKASRSLSMVSPAGRTMQLDLGPAGRVERVSRGSLAPILVDFDEVGRVRTLSQGSGDDLRQITFAYDPISRLRAMTGPLGRTVELERDPANRVLRWTLADGRVVSLAYDANGNLTELTPPGRPTHRMTYTGGDRALSYTPPEVGQGPTESTRRYDPAGRLVEITRAEGDSVVFSYDAAGRLTSVGTTDGTTTLTHDTAGRVSTVGSDTGVDLTYTYDGALTTEVRWSGEVSGSVARTHDHSYRVASEQVSDSEEVTFDYDADSLPIRAGALTMTRDPQNGFVTATLLGGVSTTRSYNTFGEVSSESAAFEGAELYLAELARDGLGRIVRKVETIQSTVTEWEYEYDLAGRLAAVRKDGVTVDEYSYDGNGNRTTHVGTTGSLTAEYDAQDRLTHYGGLTYTYSAAGDLAHKASVSGAVSYSYESLGALRTVDLDSGIRIDYLIDGQGRRVGKKTNGELVLGLLYADPLRPIAELDGSGAVVSRFVYGDRLNVPAFMLRNGATYRILSDHLGSPRLVVDTAGGAIAQRLNYDVFGRVTLDTNPGFQPFGFAGGIYDPQTRLVRFGSRDYDPEVGRWTAKDPLGFGGGETNLYVYAGNDPVNASDGRGLYRELVHRLLTYRWARDSGFDKRQAFAIADANQRLDRGWSSPFNPFGGVQRHFRDRGGIREDLLGAIADCDLEAFGRQLHALQDSYSHEGYNWWTLGHLPVTSPDDFNPFSHRDRLMETATRYFLGEMRRRMGR